LLSLSPLDGRYAGRLEGFAEECFSEHALIRARVRIEALWFAALLRHPKIGGMKAAQTRELEGIAASFSAADSAEVKRIERKINHDAKAVEYWLRRRLEGTALEKRASLVHFGCTSWDVNNLAISLMARAALEGWIGRRLKSLCGALRKRARAWAKIPMLGRTHGQPASPTTLGKEISVYLHRLERGRKKLAGIRLAGKMNGAVGNFNAHVAAYPDVDWVRLSERFVGALGLEPNLHTTQIEPYDSLAEALDCVARINAVLTDMCRDMWSYISLDYLRQKAVGAEVGSSTMPHKVNPIDFENAEGNLGISSALLRHMSASLPISRLQRDLTDSTLTRNIGVALGHCLIGVDSTLRGIEKIAPDRARMATDLDANWQVLAEAAMSLLRARGDPDAYETLKGLTRGKGSIGEEEYREIVGQLPLDGEDRARLLELRPAGYSGLAGILALE